MFKFIKKLFRKKKFWMIKNCEFGVAIKEEDIATLENFNKLFIEAEKKREKIEEELYLLKIKKNNFLSKFVEERFPMVEKIFQIKYSLHRNLYITFSGKLNGSCIEELDRLGKLE